jgi:hypothetical protein
MASTRFVEMVENAGMLDDELQHQAIADLYGQLEADSVTRGPRDRNGSVVVVFRKHGDLTPVATATVGLAGETLVDVTEVIA